MITLSATRAFNGYHFEVPHNLSKNEYFFKKYKINILTMNILLLGSGGREHAFALKLSESPLCNALYIAPGNAGTLQHGTNIALNLNDFAGIKSFLLEKEIGMLIVGPEVPLVEGVFDYLSDDPNLQNLLIIGPSKAGAQLEGSKEFAKKFMEEYNIPTASYKSFTSAERQNGLEFISGLTPPIVLKADGLAAGKGVIISNDVEEAKAVFVEMLQGKFGDASSKIVIETFLPGIEFSVFALTDGKNYVILPEAKDYKRIGEGDTGLNTGGMGAVSPVSFFDESLREKVEKKIIEPTIHGINSRGFAYNGFVFFGLMLVGNEPYVIEYNCRMGDPETQVVFPRIKNDLVETFVKLTSGQLQEVDLEIDNRTALTVIQASGGYPESYEKGKDIFLPEKQHENTFVFHAGTKLEEGTLKTNGGRVMAVTAMGESIQEARDIALKATETISFQGKYFRSDIGLDLLEY